MSVTRARSLRKAMTPHEAKLWNRLRDMRPLGFHPRRQHPIAGFVVDFAFRRQRLIIEIDGGQHATSAHDADPDARLASLGHRVIRFWNVDVDRNLDGVVETILAELRRHAD